MKRQLKILLCIFFASIFISSILALAQETTQEERKERLREWIQKRREKTKQSLHKYGPGDYAFSLEHDGQVRTYKVHVPSSYDGKKPTSVVLNFHGGYGNAEAAERQTEMSKTSDKEGFILVYPEAVIGSLSPSGMRYQHWNGGPRAESDKSKEVDDVGFVSALLDKLEKDFNIDSRRIYATGISNGGTMVYRVACQLSGRIAAVAPIETNQLNIECNPTRPVSIIHFHGLVDRFVPYKGGVGPELPDDWKPVETTISEWVGRNGCPATAQVTYKKGGAICRTYGPCKDNTEVTLCTIEEHGHTWPGGPDNADGAKVCQSNPDGLLCKKMREYFGPVSQDISANDAMWEFFKKHPMTGATSQPVCGNNLCENQETKLSCAKDCDKSTCSEVYNEEQQQCLKKGWQKINVDVNGYERELMYKGPAQWKYGAIIAMHGGGGADSNFCSHLPKRGKFFFLSDILRGVPMEEFGDLAVKEGFAVFSLDSTYNRATDANGLSVGKRWDSLMQKGKENIDLPFIEKVIAEIIPAMRPPDSSDSIFITGISNGGFMTILASTHFSEKIIAFAPVSAGDPYSTYPDMATHPKVERGCAPGVWRDGETNTPINQPNACTSDKYLNETKWPPTSASKPFKQFHNTGDGVCDISCMRKVGKLLVEHGYKDEGAFIIDSDERSLENHFWQREYNQPLIEFFEKYANRNRK